MAALHVQLNQFEGPLGLLLYLIRKEEMDILNININEITRQYLEHIKLMKELDLEMAGDFVAMASTLIHIKSRMLLPVYDAETGEIVEHVDPRKELVQKLLEYQKYQEASKLLYERPLLGRDIYPRGMKEEIPAQEDKIIIDDGGLFSLIASYRRVIRALQKKVHRVAAKGQSIAGRILEIKDKFIVGERIRFSDLLQGEDLGPRKILISFLSVLELSKLGFLNLFQAEPLGEIYIDTKHQVGSEIINRVEEFDNTDATAVAEHLLEEAQEEAQQDAQELALHPETMEQQEALAADEMASDEEIFQAEMELENGPLPHHDLMDEMSLPIASGDMPQAGNDPGLDGVV